MARGEEEEKIYPGYILVDMVVTDDSWYVVRDTPRVTGFVGSGVYPVPIDRERIGDTHEANECRHRQAQY